MKGKKTKENKNKKPVSKAVVGVSVGAVAVIAILVGVIIHLTNTPDPEPYGFPVVTGRIPGAQGTVLTPENRDEVMALFNEVAEEDRSYVVSMSRDWIFETALTPSPNARVNNLERNSRTVFFDVLLRETGDLIFTSPFMPLGSTLEGFALDRDVDAGVHEALVVFYLVDDDYEIITDVTVGITITITS